MLTLDTENDTVTCNAIPVAEPKTLKIYPVPSIPNPRNFFFLQRVW